MKDDLKEKYNVPIERKPFRLYKLPEEDKKQDVVSVRVNPEERKTLNQFKKLFDIKSDGKMLKLGFILGTNVLQRDFPPKILRYLFRADRIKLSDFKQIEDEM